MRNDNKTEKPDYGHATVTITGYKDGITVETESTGFTRTKLVYSLASAIIKILD